MCWEEEEELSFETMMVWSGQAESTPAWQGRRESILLAGADRAAGRRADIVAKVWTTLLLFSNFMTETLFVFEGQPLACRVTAKVSSAYYSP